MAALLNNVWQMLIAHHVVAQWLRKTDNELCIHQKVKVLRRNAKKISYQDSLLLLFPPFLLLPPLALPQGVARAIIFIYSILSTSFHTDKLHSRWAALVLLFPSPPWCPN